MKNMPIPLQIRRLEEHIIAHGYDPALFDLRANIDRSLNLRENIANIDRILGIKAARTGKKELDHHYCTELSEQCEIKCQKPACQTYKKIGCQSEYGAVTGCGPVAKTRQCPISVKPYCVAPYRRQYRDKIVSVRGYCVQETTYRRCP